MNQTSPRIIAMVVGTIAVDATMGIIVLSYCLIQKINPDQVLLTAYIGLTTGLVGTLTGLLINTRSNNSATPSTPVEITNKPENPVPVESTP